MSTKTGFYPICQNDCASFLDNALGYVESSAGACEDGSASRMERVELFEKLFAGLFEPFLSSPLHKPNEVVLLWWKTEKRGLLR